MAAKEDEENRKAKLEFIDAFFKELEDKIAFLEELHNSKRYDEAKILCSCYIDALALSLYWPDERSNYNFVRILKEYCEEEIISYIHPKMLEIALLKKDSRRWDRINDKTSISLQEARGRFYSNEELLSILTSLVTRSELGKIRNELWRGTYAAIIYNEVRIPSVHGFGSADGITFDNTTFKGESVPPIEFPMLYEFVKRIVSKLKTLSLTTEKWFGHDFEK